MLFAIRHNVPIAIDTSALSNALDSNAGVRQLADEVVRRNGVLLVSKVVLFELTANADVAAVLDHIRRLQRLCRLLETRFCPSYDNADLMSAETKGWQRGPPVYERGWSALAEASSAELRRVAVDMPESAHWLKQKKATLFDIDRGLHEDLTRQGFPVESTAIAEAINADARPMADDMVITRAAELSKGRVSASSIAADPTRYKATHVLAHLIWRLCLANTAARPGGAASSLLTSEQRAQEELFGLWRTKKKGRGQGTWYDTYIAGAAAYVDLFVTDDTDQRRRCNFLRRRNLLTFRTASLAEFIEGRK
jgi:hypothetical protein